MKCKTVLIADDDATLVKALAGRLRRMGLTVVTCHDAMHALLLVHRRRPDLLLLDIKMPAGNGLAAAEMLATDRRLRELPVVMITGDPRPQLSKRSEAMGLHHVVKGQELWPRLEPLVRRLLDLPPVEAEPAEA